jgi:uncharacterized repeat protein (TIGR01451 family)
MTTQLVQFAREISWQNGCRVLTIPLTAPLIVLAFLAVPTAAAAATRATANYTIITDSLDSGGAVFSPNYANRAALEPVVGYSGATIPDSTTRFLYHGFIPQLAAPLVAVADVAVSLTATPILSAPGEVVTFSGVVTNHGPELAGGVVLTLTLPANVNYTGAVLSQGTATLAGNLLQCSLGTIAANDVATVAVQVTPAAIGSALVLGGVTSDAVDPALGNNEASAQSNVVTTVTWTGAGNGSWSSPANWNPAIVPGTNHRVVVAGGAVGLVGSVTVAALDLTGGRITGGHRLTVSTLAAWTGGEIQNSATLVIPAGSLLRLTGDSPKALRSANLENNGTTRLESAALQSVFGALITNTGLFEIAGDPSFLRYQGSGFVFHNHAGATLRKSAGTGTSSLELSTFRNDGLAEVLTGTMEFAGIMINNATNRAAAGTQMRYTKANYFNHGCAIEGPGLQRIVQATTLADDATTFAGAIRGDFEIANGIMFGTFTHTGSITWSGGSFQGGGVLTIPPGGTLRLVGGSARGFYGYGLVNQGTVRLESASFQGVSGGATVDNHGLFEIAGDLHLQRFQGAGFVLTNHSGATFSKSAGTGTSSLALSTFRNDGLAEVLTGTLEFAGIMINNATNRAAAGTEMRYTKANYFNHGCAIEGPGLQRIVQATTLADDATTFAGAIRGDFEIANGIMYGTFTHTGSITWSGGIFQGGGVLTIPPGSMLRLVGGSARSFYGYRLVNQGTVRLESASFQGVFGGATINNHGLFEIAGDLHLQRFQGAGFVLTNHSGATFSKSAGTGTSTLDLSLFRNDGVLDLRSGTSALTGGYAPGATANLNIYVGGTTPGTQFSRLTATGEAALNGTLNVILMNGFTPGAGNAFPILTAASRTGTFTTFVANPVGNGLALAPVYQPAGVTLQLVPGAASVLNGSVAYTNGQLRFAFQSGIGGTYVVEATVVLCPGANWIPLATYVANDSVTQFADADAGLYPTRFYRVGFRP